MPTLNDVYQKFGETSEAAQLLETELGNILLVAKARSAGIFETANPEAARQLLDQINRNTLGQLLRQAWGVDKDLGQASDLLIHALGERNRLSLGVVLIVSAVRDAASAAQLPAELRGRLCGDAGGSSIDSRHADSRF